MRKAPELRAGYGSRSSRVMICILFTFVVLLLIAMVRTLVLTHNPLIAPDHQATDRRSTAPASSAGDESHSPTKLPASGRTPRSKWKEPSGSNKESSVLNESAKDDPLRPVFDPDSDAGCAARTTHFTLVIGIPTVDLARGYERRKLQRETWLKYAAADSSSAQGAPTCPQQQQDDGKDDHRSSDGGHGASSPNHNNKNNKVLARFLLGLHPDNDHKISGSARAEAAANGDVIVLNMREGRASTAKTSGGAGYWGLESEVGMSRKAYLWYVLATRYDADFIAKADDDLFLRVNIVASMMHSIASTMRIVQVGQKSWHSHKRFPELLCGNKELTDGGSLVAGGASSSGGAGSHAGSTAAAAVGSPPPHDHHHHQRFYTPYVYWGRMMKWGAVKGDASSKFPFIGGMFVAMSRALAVHIQRSSRAAVNNVEPFQPGDAARLRYKQTNHDHEDVMVGRWIYDERLPVCVLSDCRFHDVHVGANKAAVKSNSLGLHHLRVDEYRSFMSKFSDDVQKQERAICGYADHALERLRNSTAIHKQATRIIYLC